MNAATQKLLQQAVAAHRAGRLDEARPLYARVLAAVPACFDALHLSGFLAHQSGRHQEAVALLARALRLQPHSALCALRLGAARLALGELAGAEQHFRDAVAHQPDLVPAWNALASLLQRQGRLDEARHACERALAKLPDNAEALERMGAIVATSDGLAAAEPWFRRETELHPDCATGWTNLGIALAMTHRPEEALPCLDRALVLAPGHAHTLAGRAVAKERLHDLPAAIEDYTAALVADPNHHEARSARLLALHYLDDVSPELLWQQHRAYGGKFTPARGLRSASAARQRIRVALVSPDLRTHSVAYFIEPLLAHLPKDKFEIFLYHDHAVVDDTSRRLRALAAEWRHTAGLPMDSFEALVRADAPDIALDLAGHTSGNRLPAFAHRLAPVQISYLGYPDTTGLETMDYRLTDDVCDPAGETDARHSEELLRFAPTAWAYQPPVEAPAVARRPATRGGPVTFGCFSNFAKVNDSTLRAWAAVLAGVPGSRLLLKGHGLGSSAAQERQRARIATCGLDPARVDFLGRAAGTAEHLATYARVDIALDTFPYNGTTTTCEALWMGVPVITHCGGHHAARVGASLLTAAGHTEWIARNWDDYIRTAYRLAKDPPQLGAVSARLRDDLSAGPLLDHAGQAARFAAALRECWQAVRGHGRAAA